ncbi:MAG: family 43 glycosylhydrolase, partial [Prevotella sp.]|nr:family 43 glycosylhydrolase [Prevotella sp.]
MMKMSDNNREKNVVMKVLLFYLFTFLPLTAFGYDLKRVSVHDPSVVWDPSSKTYYIFGSHRAAAKTTDLMNWTAFAPTYDYSAYNPSAWSGAYGNYSIDGNQWAPDVIWNKAMKKWCMYLSINGPTWNSSIVLLTAENIEGPYLCQGPVVFSGFNVTSTAGVSYKHTDLEKVIGTQASLPERYNVGNKWGERWPHCIDPCVFYDEEG